MRKKIIKYVGNKITTDSEKINRYKELRLQIAELEQELEPLEQQIKSDLKEYMGNNHKKSLKVGGLAIQYRPEYTRTMFNSTSLKETDIDTYNMYTYEQFMSASVVIKLDM